MTTGSDSTEGRTYREVELTEPVRLCDSRGRLHPPGVGWSRHPLHDCNLSGHWPRKKRWNYWCVTSDRYLFSITLASVDYLGLAFAYFLEYETNRFIEKTVTVPLGRGCVLPDTVRAEVRFESREMSLSFAEDPERTRIRVDSPSFGGATLSAELEVDRPRGHETLNVVIPWSADRFHFTSKQNCLPAAGSVSIRDETFDFPAGTAFACLDFGRGVWRYSTAWNWASSSGTLDGRPVGLNLGGTWTDGTGLNENAIFLDGRISKIHEDVSFAYDPSDLMKPWSVKTQSSKRIDLRFVPFFERIAATNLLLLRSVVHQLVGRFSGTILPDDEDPLRVEGMIGWVEQHHARW